MNSTWLYHGPVEASSKFKAKPGVYLLECWGAQGSLGGKGAYVKGIIAFKRSTKLFIFVGSAGSSPGNISAFNGGGTGQQGGGGASDIRLINDTWFSFPSLKSRIIVAGGGGGSDGVVDQGFDNGGHAGGLIGNNSRLNMGKGGNQTSGGNGYAPGSFGAGGGSDRYGTEGEDDGNGGGGGGYYGGGSSTNIRNGGGGGGSSFISGYPGCNAISDSSTNNLTIHTGQPNHYSGLVFIAPEMIDGISPMPSPFGGLESGHSGNGCIRITLLTSFSCSANRKCPISLSSLSFMMMFIQTTTLIVTK